MHGQNTRPPRRLPALVECVSKQGAVRGVMAGALLGLALLARAQTPTVYEEQHQLVRGSRDVATLGPQLFGDEVSLYNGSLSFTQTDVSLPGNNELPVRVGRRLSTGASRLVGGAFGDWELDIPHLKGVFGQVDGWNVGAFTSAANKYKRCSYYDLPADARTQTGQALVPAWEFWSGNRMYVPGQGEQDILLWNGVSPRPADGQAYPLATKGGWVFRCLPSLPRGQAGEGFLAVAPDGTQYRFDWLVARPHPPYQARGAAGRGTAPATQATRDAAVRGPGGTTDATIGWTLLRNEVWILPTQITDRFGNTVTYTYSSTRPWRLESISASDGRLIQLSYDTSTDIVRSVSDGTRTWLYHYDSANTNPRLTAVTQPDGARWLFGGDNLQVNPSYYQPPGDCSGGGAFHAAPRTLTMTHPSGATGSFAVMQLLRGRSQVPLDCVNASGSWVNWWPVQQLGMALTSKTISGPGMPASTWAYAWGPANGSLSTCAGCPETVSVEVTDPTGAVTRHTYGNRWQQTEGKLLMVEEGVGGGTALRTTTYRYRSPTAGPYPEWAGSPLATRSDSSAFNRHAPQDQKTVFQQGASFTWEATVFDTWARATRVTRSSSLGYGKTDLMAYADHLPRWVIGQQASVTDADSGRTETLNEYHPDTAARTAHYRFGLRQGRYDYWPDGTLKTVYDPADRPTVYSNYKRGLAQLITHPDATTESAVVNDLGLITSLTNGAGTTTYYGYDAMGRLNLVTYPAGDPVAYNPTQLSFQAVAAEEFGLPAGHWRQTVSTGNARKETYFDGLWRPVLTREYDAADVAGTQRMVLRVFDGAGHERFQSYPQRSIAAVSATPTGVATEYDALGRIARRLADSEQGWLVTSHAYLPGLQTGVTNARGYTTTTTYSAYDDPGQAQVVAIAAPEGVSVGIGRDVWGKAQYITRAGGGKSVTRSYVYDGNQRLCKTIEPESGATVQAYDAAGNIAWRASGLNLPATGSCDQGSVPAARQISHGYDARNRLTSTSYGDGSPGVTRSYTADGLLQQTVTQHSGNPITNYYYNNRRALVREQYTWWAGVAYGSWDGWNFSYDVNANGHAASLTDPWGAMAYSPNALGEPTQVSGYASNVTYHPNGAVAGYTLNNGVAHSLTLNARGLPLRTTYSGIAQDAYTYDASGNVTSITDEQEGVNTRSMPWYDGLDRLRQANGPWGGGSYTYDALDNLVASSVGGRSLSHNIDTATNRLTSLTGSQSISIGYDANGNITNRGSQGFSFDIGNRMVNAPGKVNYYLYDGHGRRSLAWFADGGWMHQAYTKDGKLRFGWRNTEGGRRHVYLGDKLIAERDEGGVTTYSHTDALGSPIARTNSSGGLVSRTRYEPYGATVAGSTNPTKIGFTGHVNDADTGLVYMQQRYYDPIAGRFLSVDPVVTDWEAGESFNRYVYVHNNPYRYTDPDGRQAAMAGCFGGPLGCAIGVGLTATTIYVGAKAVSDTGRILQNSSGSSGSGSDAGKKGEAAAPPAAAAGAAGSGNTNPYKGPVSEPVVVVDQNGNAIPVGSGQSVSSSPNGDYQQVLGANGKPTGDRMDRGGHKGQKDPKAQGPHGHRPGVKTPDGNPHLPINPPKPEPSQ